MRTARARLAGGILGVVGVALAGAAAWPAAAQVVASSQRSASVWEAGLAPAGGLDAVLSAATARDAGDPLRLAAERLRAHVEKREGDRAARIESLGAELDKRLAGEVDDRTLSKALRSAVELEMLSPDRQAFLRQDRIRELQRRTEASAKAAEGRRDWLMARELYVLLHALMEEDGTYKKDVHRLTQRLAMMQMYVPERMWKLRNEKIVAAGDEALPPYNPVGNDFEEKLRPITESLVLAVMARGGQHVDQVGVNAMVLSGLEALRTMATTPDLAEAFPSLGKGEAVDRMLGAIAREEEGVRALTQTMDLSQARQMLTRLGKASEQGVGIPRQALLHEFGNGMMLALDDFSAIIWPDELRKFQRTTQGRLIGVGVQIQPDAARIRVVAPIDGSPAQAAGIHAGDLITKVNSVSTYGMALDQAVELITGPAGTKVTLTVERDAAEEGEDPVELDFTITRALIDIRTVKGWKRTGAGEDDWDWFADPEARIGYVRLTQFTDTTTREFDSAIDRLTRDGMRGLVLDLRYNPGGLLDQAVSIVQRFVDVRDGYVVMMSGPRGMISSPEFTDPSVARLAHTPVVVLINENSASASEIVSGALKHYGRSGDIRCLVVGDRSFGKGSVQNVWDVPNNSLLKLTIQYYMLPDKSIIHRKPGAASWGVEPDVRVEMLPRQMNTAMAIRRNADIPPADFRPQDLLPAGPAGGEDAPIVESQDEAAGRSNDPRDMLDKGIDIQLEAALVLLRGEGGGAPHAQK